MIKNPGRQTDGQTEEQTDGQTDRQTETRHLFLRTLEVMKGRENKIESRPMELDYNIRLRSGSKKCRRLENTLKYAFISKIFCQPKHSAKIRHVHKSLKPAKNLVLRCDR